MSGINRVSQHADGHSTTCSKHTQSQQSTVGYSILQNMRGALLFSFGLPDERQAKGRTMGCSRAEKRKALEHPNHAAAWHILMRSTFESCRCMTRVKAFQSPQTPKAEHVMFSTSTSILLPQLLLSWPREGPSATLEQVLTRSYQTLQLTSSHSS